MSLEFVIYNNIKYYIQTSGRYYVATSSRPRSLHRKVWTDHYGEIPKGYVIHHIDHDWRNNDISNLEMVEQRKHLIDHFKEKVKSKVTCIECHKEFLTVFPSRTRYCSRKCSIKKHYEQCKTESRACLECGKDFITHRYRNILCCGYKCSNKKRGREKKISSGNYERSCFTCGVIFKLGKDLNILNCSRSCGMKMARNKIKRVIS